MIYAILKMDIDLYHPQFLRVLIGELVKIDNHRNGDELYNIKGHFLGFFPKGYLRYYTVKPSKLLDLVMK